MTTTRGNATTNGNDVGHVEMEVAGPPARPLRDGTSTSSRRRLVMTLSVALLVVAGGVAATRWPSDQATTSPPVHRARTSPPAVSPAAALDGLPQGPAPTIPYLLDGELHVADLTLRTDANRLLSAGGTVLVGRTGDEHARWWILDGADLVGVPELDDVLAPSLSPGGHLLVWTSFPDERTTRVAAWSPSGRAELEHVDLEAPYARCCGGGQEIEILGVDAEDQVYWTSRHGYQVWRPWSDSEPRRLTGIDAVHQVAPVGPVRQDGTLGRVDSHGRWTGIVALPTDQDMVWTADGTLVAYGGDDTGAVASKESPTDVWVLDAARGVRTHLGLPDGVRAAAVAFESDQWVLVEAFADPRHHHLLRCSVRDGSCERTLAPGRWQLPERAS